MLNLQNIPITTTNSVTKKRQSVATTDWDVAKQLLLRTNLNINEIAIRVNPGISAASFSAGFRYHVGVSPMEFRRRGGGFHCVTFGKTQKKSVILELRANRNGDGSLYGVDSGIRPTSVITSATVTYVQFSDVIRNIQCKLSLGDFEIMEDKLGGLIHTVKLDEDLREAMLYVNPRNGLLSFQQYVLPRPRNRVPMSGHATIELDVSFRQMNESNPDFH